jgi:uncharacterized protein YkwD
MARSLAHPRIAAAALLGVLALALVGCTHRPDAEAWFHQDLNARRAQHGLGPVAVNPGLEAAARNQVVHMMANGFAHGHDLRAGALPSSRRFGENIGRGRSREAIAEALWNSPGHRAIILGSFTHVGVGVYEDGNGVLWVAFRFEGP